MLEIFFQVLYLCFGYIYSIFIQKILMFCSKIYYFFLIVSTICNMLREALILLIS
jgi:hypothetical protein